MSRCEALQAYIKAYGDGELGIVRRLAVRLHLARCRTCREEMTAMEDMTSNLRAGDTGGLPAELRAKILTGSTPELPDGTARPGAPTWLRKHPKQLWAS